MANLHTGRRCGRPGRAFSATHWIPAYNRKNIKAGAFVPYKKEGKKRRLLLFIYPDITTYHRVKRTIWNDTEFRKAAQPYFDKTAPTRLTSISKVSCAKLSTKVPSLLMPDKNRTLFELRTYHSPNEEANHRKVAMFNKDEIDVFDKVGINSVCYGEVLAGPIMPAVMYLTWYKDEPTRNAAWDKFRAHPDWQRIKNLPEYAYTATRNTSLLLSPLPYSQI